MDKYIAETENDVIIEDEDSENVSTEKWQDPITKKDSKISKHSKQVEEKEKEIFRLKTNKKTSLKPRLTITLGRRITVLHAGQPKQCSFCLKSMETGCLGMGNRRNC